MAKEIKKKEAGSKRKKQKVIFCDIGDTLGKPVLSSGHLVSVTLFDYVTGILTGLHKDGHRLGIISNTGNETATSMNNALKKSKLYKFFEKDLLIYSSVVNLTKNSPEIFRLAAKKAGLAGNPGQCIFVGEDKQERDFAAKAGLLVCDDLRRIDTVLPVPEAGASGLDTDGKSGEQE